MQKREWRRAEKNRRKALSEKERSYQMFNQAINFREQTALAVLDNLLTRECPAKASKRDKQALNASFSGNQSD